MTVLNAPNALPSIAVVLHRFLVQQEGSAEEERVFSMLSPTTLSGEADGTDGGRSRHLAETIKLLTEIGYVNISDGWLVLDEGLQSRLDPRGPALRRTLRTLFLSEAANGRDLWESDRGARDFTRAAAWYLCQNVWRPPARYNDEGTISAFDEQHRQFPEGLRAKAPLFNTSTRWNAFERWAVFLGLAAYDVVAGKAGLIPDCTVAVLDTLEAVLPAGDHSLPDALTLLAGNLPVLDGGGYWTQVVNEMNRDFVPEPETATAALSHALLRLRAQKVLDLSDRADAPRKVRVVGATGTTRTFARLTWRGTAT